MRLPGNLARRADGSRGADDEEECLFEMPIDGMVARWLRSTGVYFVSVSMGKCANFCRAEAEGVRRGGACDKERRSPHKSPSRKVKVEIYLSMDVRREDS